MYTPFFKSDKINNIIVINNLLTVLLTILLL